MKNWNSQTTITKHFTRSDAEYYHTLSDLVIAVDSALSSAVINVNVHSLNGGITGQRKYKFDSVESCGKPTKLDGTCSDVKGSPVSHGQTPVTNPLFCPACSAPPQKIVKGSEKWIEMPPPESSNSYCQMSIPYMAIWRLVPGQQTSNSVYIPSFVREGGVVQAGVFGTVDTHLFSKNLVLESAICNECVY